MSVEYYQALIDRGGGMISCGDNLGVMIGTDIKACPPAWVFIDINREDVTKEELLDLIEKAVIWSKEGRKNWPGKETYCIN